MSSFGIPVATPRGSNNHASLYGRDAANAHPQYSLTTHTHTHAHTDLPTGELGYAEATANQGSITTETDLTNLSVTISPTSNRKVKITGYIGVQSTAAGDYAGLRIKKDTTELQSHQVKIPDNATTTHLIAEVRVLASAGSHTYKLTLERTSGTGTFTSVASSTNPAFILVEDLGAE